jgi:hypothetical protein
MAVFILVLLSLASQLTSEPASRAAADRQNAQPFAIAVLRRDGVVSPFAAYDGKHWTAPWPVDVHAIDLPIDVQGIPSKWWGKAGAVSEMTAWVDGVNRGPVHLLRPALLPLMCERRIAVISDYHGQPTEAPSLLPPYPKDGLAVTGTQRVEPIEILSAQSREWAPTAKYLAAEFNRAEQEAIRAFTDWDHPVSPEERRQIPVELEAMYRAPMDEAGWTAYYVEAVKRYTPQVEDDGCGLVTSASGWMAVGPGGKRAAKLNARVTYCDRRDVTYMLPLGLIPVDGRSYWAFQLSGFGREGYLVVRPTPKHVEVNVRYSAGLCPRGFSGPSPSPNPSPQALVR